MNSEMDSPTGLDIHPQPPSALRVRKEVGIVILIGLVAVVAAIIFGIHERQQRQAEVFSKTAVEQRAVPAISASKEFMATIPVGDVPTLTQGISSLEGQLNSPREDQRNPTALNPPIIQALPGGQSQHLRPHPVSPPAYPYENTVERADDKERNLAYQKELAAIDAPTGIGGSGRTYGGNANLSYTGRVPSPSNSSSEVFNESGGGIRVPSILGEDSRAVLGGVAQTGEYNSQNGQDQKTAFIAQARQRVPQNYLQSFPMAPASKFEIAAGWDIPATLEQSINSDQPGEIRALVRENVCDTATGKYVLIPQGSRLIGSYSSVVSYGQDGVQVVWDRVIFPDASSLNLNGMIGQDAKGESGLRYSVDHHYSRLLGFAVLTSLFSAGFQLSQNRPGTILAQPSAGEVVASAVGSQVSQLGAEITRRNLNVQPTIKIPAGYRFNVRVNRDIAFDAPYSPSSQSR
jgi:type IV secretion system protein VirB10